MTYQHPAQAQRPADNHRGLRLLALTAVVIGLVLLAAAAFVLSYAGIHEVALSAGVSSRWARLYPLIFDAMLVIAGAAVLSLRGAGLPSRCYAWLTMLALFAAAGGADTVHATGIALARKPTAAAAAIIPWALVLIGFGLLLCMLRHARLRRAAAAATPERVVQERSGHVEVRAGVREVRADGSDPARTPAPPIVSASPVPAVTPSASPATRPALASASSAAESPPPAAAAPTTATASPPGAGSEAAVDPELDLALEAEPGPDDPASDEGSTWFWHPRSEEPPEDDREPDLPQPDVPRPDVPRPADRPASAFSPAPTMPLDAEPDGSVPDLGPGEGNGALLGRARNAGPDAQPVSQLPPHPRVAPESTFEPSPDLAPAPDAVPGTTRRPQPDPQRGTAGTVRPEPESIAEPESIPELSTPPEMAARPGRTEQAPEAAATAHADTESGPDPAAEADTQPQPIDTGQPRADAEAEPEAPIQPQANTDAEPGQQPAAEPQPAAETATEPQPAKPEPAPKTDEPLTPEPEPDPHAPADAAPASEADPEPESETTPPVAPFDRMRSSPVPPDA